MKKSLIILITLCFLLSGSVLTFAEGDKGVEIMVPDLAGAGDDMEEETGGSGGGDKEEEEEYQGDYKYVVINPKGKQVVLGGKSENAFKGLDNAADHSRSVKKVKSDSKSFTAANSSPKKNDNKGSNKGTKKDNAGKNNGNKDKGNNGKKNKGKK
jgi:hypothetical protein